MKNPKISTTLRDLERMLDDPDIRLNLNYLTSGNLSSRAMAKILSMKFNQTSSNSSERYTLIVDNTSSNKKSRRSLEKELTSISGVKVQIVYKVDYAIRSSWASGLNVDVDKLPKLNIQSSNKVLRHVITIAKKILEYSYEYEYNERVPDLDTFISRLIKYGYESIKVKKDYMYSKFTEEILNNGMVELRLEETCLKDEHKELTEYMITKFVSYTNRPESFIPVLKETKYYIKFMNALKVIQENIDSPTSGKLFDYPPKTQETLINIWVQAQIDAYKDMNNNVYNLPVEIGFISGSNDKSRNNALTRFQAYLYKLKNGPTRKRLDRKV